MPCAGHSTSFRAPPSVRRPSPTLQDARSNIKAAHALNTLDTFRADDSISVRRMSVNAQSSNLVSKTVESTLTFMSIPTIDARSTAQNASQVHPFAGTSTCTTD